MRKVLRLSPFLGQRETESRNLLKFIQWAAGARLSTPVYPQKDCAVFLLAGNLKAQLSFLQKYYLTILSKKEDSTHSQ